MDKIGTEADFFEAHAAHLRTVEEFGDALRQIQADYKADLEQRYKEQYPRRKFDAGKVAAEPWFADVRKDWEAKHSGVHAEREAYVTRAGGRLRELAVETVMPISDDMILVTKTRGANYSSQGYGANRYAKNSAMFEADKAEHNGLTAEVRTLDTAARDRWGIAYDTYGVFANTNEAGLALLEFMEQPPLREQVRLSWKRGTNPRVYMPFLPHGYEEKEGLDFFGGDTRESEDHQPTP